MGMDVTKKYRKEMPSANSSEMISILFLPTSSTYFPRNSLENSPPMTYIPALSPASASEHPNDDIA